MRVANIVYNIANPGPKNRIEVSTINKMYYFLVLKIYVILEYKIGNIVHVQNIISSKVKIRRKNIKKIRILLM